MTEIIQEAVSDWKENLQVSNIRSVGGGSINQAYHVKTNEDELFVKINSLTRYPGMFHAEMQGLELLSANSSFVVPQPLHVFEGETYAALIMEYIPTGRPAGKFWEDFGQSLAEMHQQSSDSFGLDHDNYIGSLPQSNTNCDSWSEFFWEQRLEPQLRQAINSGLLERSDEIKFKLPSQRFDEFFPIEAPSLLHGDLWSGNYLSDENNSPILIDPAVYYGHRLMDIGMSKLFGGFDSRMYGAYNEVSPLPANWMDGVEVANLYPLLVHVNLFGSGYVSQVRSILNRYA